MKRYDYPSEFQIPLEWKFDEFINEETRIEGDEKLNCLPPFFLGKILWNKMNYRVIQTGFIYAVAVLM